MEDNKSSYEAHNLNLSKALRREIEHTVRRGFRPEEITLLKLSKRSRGEKSKPKAKP